MKTLFWVIVLFALAVGLVVAARYNEGYVLVVLPPYRVEIALNLLLVLLGAGFIVLYSFVRLVTGAVLMPARVREYRLARRRERAHSSLLSALEAYFEGRYARAEQAGLQAIELGENTRLAAIVAARAAHELRAYDRRDMHLERVTSASSQDEDPLRVMTQAELLLEERRPEEAIELLKTLPRKHTAALRLELKAHQQMRQWENVAALIPELEKRGVVDADQASKLRTHALAQTLRRKGGDAHALDEAWKKLPDAQKRDTTVAAAAAHCYVALGRAADAQAIVEQSLESSWDSDLVAIYAQAAGDTVKQIERAERWLESHPSDAALLLTLGQLCARQGLWGKAESYLEAGVSIEPSYNGHLELARLHERLGNVDGARRHYRESLELALAKLNSNLTP